MMTSIIVWYNPSQQEVNNILTYSHCFSKVYIVDNSTEDNSKLASNISNSIYIPLKKNTGIAYALNRGIEIAEGDGFKWVMTMDQDSIWSKDDINKYLIWAKQIIKKCNKIGSLAPFAKIKNKSWAGVLFWPIVLKLTKPKGVKNVDRVICSSNIVSIKAWKEINGYDEKMFIDQVDFEFCYRLRLNNYKIIQNFDISFGHTIGADKLTILPWDNHNENRLYYILRNIMYIIKKYPTFAKKYNYTKDLKKIILDTCVFDRHRKQHRLILEKAKKDCEEMLTNATPDSSTLST